MVWIRFAAALVLAAWGVGCAVYLTDPGPRPFVWRDVAVVYLLAALPLAGVAATFARRHASPWVLVGLAVLSLGTAYVLFPGPFRVLTAFGLTVAPCLALAAWLGRPGEEKSSLALSALVSAAALLIVPMTYVGARCRHDVRRLGELLEQSRFGEALALARSLQAVDPSLRWNDRPMTDVTTIVGQAVRELEAQVASPLVAGKRLDRARSLAMLGRTDEALATLEGVSTADADNLRATIRETRGDWAEALDSYCEAKATWQAADPSPSRAEGLLRATTGIAYCQRKLGRYDEAEAAYREVVKLAPTADSHFLLAQFYEDAQQTEPAREHARRAMALAPGRYERRGKELIDKLAAYHFGCLAVFAAESRRSARRDGR